jgi:hypothetical protein
MNQSGGLLRAGMQEAIYGNGRGLVGIGEAVRAAHAQALVTARDEVVHAQMFQLQRGHRGSPTISSITASGFPCWRWPVLLSFWCLLFIWELLSIFVHEVHGSQGLELRASDATHAIEPFGVYVSRQHMRTPDISLVREDVSADSGSSAS